MRTLPILLALLVATAPVATAHKFNHEDRHEWCQVYGAPQSHAVGDGHPNHSHDDEDNATLALPDHDPCKQIRMGYPDFENKMPLSQIPPPAKPINITDLLFSDGDSNNTEVFVGGEAYQFPLNTSLVKKRSGFAIRGNLQAAGMGLPGNGSHDNPYIIEGYIITGNLAITDTSKCFVVRNNVVVSRNAVAPLIPDPGNIFDLLNLTPYWNLVNQTAHDLRNNYTNLSAHWDALKAAWDGNLTAWNGNRTLWDANKTAFESESAEWDADFEAFEDAYVAAIRRTEGLADEFEGYADQYAPTTQPARSYLSYMSGDEVTDLDAIQPAFEAYQEDLDDDLTAEDVEGWIMSTPPPDDPPASWVHGAEAWEEEKLNYEIFQDDIVQIISDYWSDVLAAAPNETAYAAFQANHTAFLANYTSFLADYDAFVADYDAFIVGYEGFQDEFDGVWASTGEQIAQANAHFQKALNNTFEYAGTLGKLLFNTTEQLARWVIKVLFNILDIDDPNNAAQNTGQLILDWNGQCVHAYNNVAADLRVNQNNDRTGYATGGAIEDNRFFTIGQIRHYDGIFRQNEVGNRAFLHNMTNASVVPLPGSVRSVNNDGANQGWYFDNVFYGQIDLDFHGHHHAAGFFAPTSHYHGSTRTEAYMQAANGTCSATYASPNATRNGPWVDYPTDNDVHVLGQLVLERPDAVNNCLPHFDHAKRWTSVYFNDNIIIDPNGVGLRFEDREHRADDEWAASENMLELKRPHFHQKFVQMENNTVVGQVFLDVVNAAGTDLWSDNWEPVLSPPGTARTQEALAHPGAEVVNSHPLRNDAWVDVRNNTFLQTKAHAVVLSDADDLTLMRLTDNRAFAMPKAVVNKTMNATDMLAWLKTKAKAAPDLVFKDIGNWTNGNWTGQDRGNQTFATFSNVRDHYTIEHCGNVARGLDYGIYALDRMYDNVDEDTQGVRSCATANDWGEGIKADVVLGYTAAPVAPQRCTERLRDATARTDDAYVSEALFDVLDGVVAASTCETVLSPLLPLPGP